MSKLIFRSGFFSSLLFVLVVFAAMPMATIGAQEVAETTPAKQEFYRAEIVKILETSVDRDPLIRGGNEISQKAIIKLLEGPEAQKIVTAEYLLNSAGRDDNRLAEGQTVLVTSVAGELETVYYITDRYRLPAVIWLVALFILLAIIFAGWHGLRALVGLMFSGLVIIGFILPRIVAGDNPFIISLIGALLIAVVSLYIAHGFNKRTSIALVGTLITITLAIVAAIVSVNVTSLFGLGSEEAFFLQISELAELNLRGLLLGGIIIGVLGVLDDITTAQSAAIEELHKANPRLTFGQLYRRGHSIGREHIASLVNTLALAYVGASFPLLLLFIQYPQPLHIVLNSEIIVEEIVRTLIGSSALILAVPITTLLAAYIFSRHKKTD